MQNADGEAGQPVQQPEQQAAGRGRGRGNQRNRVRGHRGQHQGNARDAHAQNPPPDRTQAWYPSCGANLVPLKRQLTAVYIPYLYILFVLDLYNHCLPVLNGRNAGFFTQHQFVGYCFALMAKRIQGILENRESAVLDPARLVNVPTLAIPAPLYAYLVSLGDYIDPGRKITFTFDWSQDYVDEFMLNASAFAQAGPQNYVWNIIGDQNAALCRSYFVLYRLYLEYDVTPDEFNSAALRLDALQNHPPIVNLDDEQHYAALQAWLDAVFLNPLQAIPAIGNVPDPLLQTTVRLSALIAANRQFLSYTPVQPAPLSRIYVPLPDFQVSLRTLDASFKCNHALPTTFNGSPSQFAVVTQDRHRIEVRSIFELTDKHLGMCHCCTFATTWNQLPEEANFEAIWPNDTVAAARSRWFMSSIL